MLCYIRQRFTDRVVYGGNYYSMKECLKDALFENVDLTGCDFQGLKLQGLCFDKHNLSGCSFLGADLSYCSFRYCNMPFNLMLGAVLRSADFRYSNMEGCDFEWADLSYTKLDRCELHTADFRFAYLERTQMKFCNLRECRFERTTMNDVCLHGSNIKETQFKLMQKLRLDFDGKISSAVYSDKLRRQAVCSDKRWRSVSPSLAVK